MANPENNTEIEEKEVDNSLEEPILPSWAFLLAAAIGLLMVIVVLFATTGFNIVGWAGIGISVISLIFWAFMFPEEVLNLVRGRALTFGGLGLLVTVVVIVAAVLVYSVVSDQRWSRDFSERDVFSLDTEVRDFLQTMGTDPSVPTVEILAFYPRTLGGQRDRISVLLQDMVNNSNGKIRDYQFIEPDIEPLRTETYLGENPITPRIVVVAVDEETGTLSTERFEIAARDNTGQVVSGQFQIINAILSLSVEGDFRAYFLDVDGGLDIDAANGDGANGIVSDIEDEWTVETISPLTLPAPDVILNDPAASAEVMIIAGGTQALNDAEIAALNAYLQNGGDLVVLADINTDGGVATALNENFSNMLWENFGVRVRNDVVLDPNITIDPLGRTYLVDNYGTHTIVSGLNPADNQLVMTLPHSIEISDTPPGTVQILVSTGEDGYAKDNVDFSRDLTEADLAFVEGDRSGEIPLAVAAENPTTGARIVIFGSPDLMVNAWRAYANIEAPEVAEAAIYWASDAQNLSETVRQIIPEPPSVDAPIFLREQEMRWMGFVAYGITTIWYVAARCCCLVGASSDTCSLV